MKREGVIITRFVISQPKQVKLFQVKIPREAKNIIGIETGIRWISGTLPVLPPPPTWLLPFLLQRSIAVGEVKLQSYEKANIFYTGEAVLNQNMAFADFSSEHFAPKEYSHGYSAHEDEVKVNGETTILQGVYRDKVFEQVADSFRYEVKVYVWMESR